MNRSHLWRATADRLQAVTTPSRPKVNRRGGGFRELIAGVARGLFRLKKGGKDGTNGTNVLPGWRNNRLIQGFERDKAQEWVKVTRNDTLVTVAVGVTWAGSRQRPRPVPGWRRWQHHHRRQDVRLSGEVPPGENE